MASEVERVALQFKNIQLAKAEGKENPITGQHVELTIQPVVNQEIDKADLKAFLTVKLPNHMTPMRIKISKINIGHRYKKFEMNMKTESILYSKNLILRDARNDSEFILKLEQIQKKQNIYPLLPLH